MREKVTVRVKIIIVALIIGLVWRGERITSEEGSRVMPPEALSLPEGSDKQVYVRAATPDGLLDTSRSLEIAPTTRH
ncbi:hypothetical protein SAMN05216428_104182 [Nitrosospira sp. Nsp11]|uniref:hypothetical protein n=1 Tax=Nitrosospira sp. Nsp11 TaxID=1855338 RepID=UPI0009211424|nr:hypothetical protein [Nitrosospira sp. Nsp11]SHL64895.1 hypothetical protein SAMN05216428_104182 [Nitrosospira sp. Nsp11]